MNQIALVQFARMDSQRLPGKPLIRLGCHKESLIEHAIQMMLAVADRDNNVHPIIICPEQDKEIIDIADKFGVEYYTMPMTFRARIWPELIQPFLFYLKDYDFVADLNLMCHPLLQLSTLKEITNLCHKLTFPFTIVTEHRGVIWDDGRDYLLGRGQLADTRNNPRYLIPAHIAYCWQQHHLHLREKELANTVIPVPMNLSQAELLDIDTKEDVDFLNTYLS